MRSIAGMTRLAVGAVLLVAAGASVAQGPPGGMPPGQAKKQGYGNMPPGQAKKYDDDGNRKMPPGQAKKYADFRFRDEDRARFYSHYENDAKRWKGRKRPNFAPGQYIPPSYTVRVVPQSYWVGAPPPPPGYQYGYSNGYVVAYNPTTRLIADVMDLVGAATGR